MSKYLINWLDMCSALNLPVVARVPNYNSNDLIMTGRLNQLIKAAGYSYETDTFSFIKDSGYSKYIRSLANDLMNRWLISDVYLAISDDEVPSTELVNRTCKKIFDKLSKNYEPFCKRLAAQDKYLTDLKDTISSTSESVTRHNDTPNSNNDYGADIYTSDITKNSNTTTTSIDAMERYGQVVATIESIYDAWLKEFREFEIYGEY